MAWPSCPACGSPNLGMVDRAADIRPSEAEIYRSYSCCCGWSCWTVEKLIAVRPETVYLRRKFAQSAVQSPSTSGKR